MAVSYPCDRKEFQEHHLSAQPSHDHDTRPPRLSATVLLLRDTPHGLEVFMVVRHHQIDFASGALVFPGGSLDENDRVAGLAALSDGGEALDEDARALRLTAVREAFEECGVLLARRAHETALIDGAAALRLGGDYRDALEAGDTTLEALAEKENLRFMLDKLAPWAHWVTPTHMPKRFDTYFFAARTPADHVLEHDGSEAVDSVWVRPEVALQDADDGKRTVIFPTRLNLQKLATFSTVDAVMAHCRATPVVRVAPERIKKDGKLYLRIPLEAGYGQEDFEVAMEDAGAVAVKRD